jgi:hypothetical protein
MPVWFPCTSQHDTSMYDANGSRDNFNNNMSTAAVFSDIEKALDATWHPGLLYKVSELEFPTSLIKLISSFLSQRKFSFGRRRNV